RLARGDLLAHLVRRRRDRLRRFGRTRRRRRLRDLLHEVDARRRRHELLVELRERAIELVAFLESLAVPSFLALDERYPLALDRPREDHRRLAFGGARLGVRVENGAEIVAIDHDRVPAERAPSPRELIHVVPP